MKRKILLIASEFGKGGAERSISLLSCYLQEEYDVMLCIMSGKGRDKYYKTCEKVIFIDPPEADGLFGKARAWYYRIKKLKAIKKQNGIDVSISFLEGPDYANILSGHNDKLILSVRGSKVYDKMISGVSGRIRKGLLIPVLYRCADRVVCVTTALSNEMARHFFIDPVKIRTIYNFYEIGKIRALAAQPLNSDEEKIFSKKVIITSGRLHPQKEQDKLLRLLSELSANEDVRLVILGDGALREALTQLATQLGLSVCQWEEGSQFVEADVYFMGFQANAFKFYKRSSLFALTSSWEGFPNVLAEALICEIPVVAADCHTGPREILQLKHLAEPVNSAIRTPVGSLLPLLNKLDSETDKVWLQEISYWLNAAPPASDEFHSLTKDLAVDVLVDQWRDVIEN